MSIIERNGLQIVQSELFNEAGLPHGWFGVSLGNMQYRPEGKNTYNDPEAELTPVLTRRALACTALGLDASRFVATKGLLQTDIAQEITAEHSGTTTGEADGYYTDVQLPVGINAADCLLAGIYDPRNKALGMVHAGGLGTSRHILPKTIHAMGQRYGSRPSDLLVAIGPSLQAAHFTPTREVDGWTLDEIRDEHTVAVSLPNGEEGYDVAGTARSQLLDRGVSPHKIDISPIDTYTSSGFYSWERDRETDPMVSMRRHAFIAALPS